MTKHWQKLVIENFDNASIQYNKKACLQRFFAQKLAEQCAKRFIQPGLWVDLGSGTGLLANELEKRYPMQSVVRVDGSKGMLIQHSAKKPTKLFNLNHGLPQLEQPPTLIASSFALHWLNKPEKKLQEWFSALAPGGWLAVVLPVKGSFPEWHNAAKLAKVKCTAMLFPSHNSLLNAVKATNIRYQKLERFTQEAPKVTSLLKPFIEVGAHTSSFPSLRISEWKQLQYYWSLSQKDNVPRLTWLVQILLVQK